MVSFFFKRLNEASIFIETSVNLLLITSEEKPSNGLAFLRKSHANSRFTNWKPSEAGFNWRGEVDLQGSVSLSVKRGICKAYFDEVVGQNGLEPSTSRLSVVCSSQLSYWPILVEISGIEPLTSCLQGRRSPSWAKPPNLYPSSNKVHPLSIVNCQLSILSVPSKLNNAKYLTLCSDLRTLRENIVSSKSP